MVFIVDTEGMQRTHNILVVSDVNTPPTSQLQRYCRFVFWPENNILWLTEALKQQRVKLHGDKIVLMIGNAEINSRMHVSLNMVRNLLQEVRKWATDVPIFVVGILPRAEKHDSVTPLIVSLNSLLEKVCGHMKNSQSMDVTFVSAHKIFLERYKFYDFDLKEDIIETRIIQPVTTFFESENCCTLNELGIRRLYRFLLGEVGVLEKRWKWSRMDIQCETELDEESRRKRWTEGASFKQLVPCGEGAGEVLNDAESKCSMEMQIKSEMVDISGLHL